MKITNVVVSGLEESILASGFPMQQSHDEQLFDDRVRLLKCYLGTDRKHAIETMNENDYNWCEKQIKRLMTLGSCEGGESHDCALVGILVSFNMTCPRLVMPEIQRYHFAEIVSSSSTMHYLKKNVKLMSEQPDKIYNFFCDYTDKRAINTFLEIANEIFDKMSENDDGTDETIAKLKAILPEGYLQTCRITTNYRQLKTWVRQRSKHRLQEWRDIVKWIHTLPLFDELTSKNKEN